MPALSIPDLQTALQESQLEGWLFYGFRGNDPIALKVLGLAGKPVGSRRWFYFVPARGEPRGLVHRIEPGMLEALPGGKQVYLSWQSLRDGLRGILGGARRVALQYSPEGHIPTVSRVDGGTLELLRAFGVEPVSSADLVQRFEARLDPAQVAGHRRAADRLHALVQEMFASVAQALRGGRALGEQALHEDLQRRLAASGLIADHGPMVGVNAHAADPHFENSAATSLPVHRGDLLLIDVWAKEKAPGSIYADITWCGFVGEEAPAEMRRVFEVASQARDAAVARCEAAFRGGAPLRGFEVDRACRDLVEKAGFGAQFLHRTGHSIHEETHGNGANIDDLETHDTRLLLPWTLFSIEPGIYFPGHFGIRTEINVLHAGDRAEVTGPGRQTELTPILARY